MNPIIRHLILQKIRAYTKARKEGKVKKYDWKKGLEKFVRGAGIVLLAQVLALLSSKDLQATKEVITCLGNAVLIAAPTIGGLIDAAINAVKFFKQRG